MTALWTLSLVLGFSITDVSFIDAKPAPQEKPVLTVLVRDLLAMDPSIRNVARAETIRILKHAGIELRWIDANGSEDPNLSHAMNSYVTIVIAAQAPNGWTRPDAMGFAPTRTGPYPRAYVFSSLVSDFLQRFMHESRPRFGMVLGHAIAHELGHLVIPGDAHGQGIMRPNWGYRQWQEALEGALLFAPSHARALRKALQSK